MKIVVMRFMTIALNLAAKDKNNIDNGKKMRVKKGIIVTHNFHKSKFLGTQA
jgi:hypothetical protein